MTNAELDEIRHCGTKGLPFGGSGWQESIITTHNLVQTIRSGGRPKRV